MNMSLIIIEGTYGAIDADDSSCHGYYILGFSSFLYTLQVDLSIYGRVIYSGEMVFEGKYFCSININSNYYFYKKLNPLTHFFSKYNNKWECQHNKL